MIERAQGSAERGADLTNRLLAFSRKQILHPAIVDVSEAINEITGLLERTLGETITIKTDLQENVWPVELDKSELENSIVNLALNSRDAINGSGEIVIRCRNTVLDPETIPHFPLSEPGSFLHLSVADNGSGMAEEIRLQAFEPFFTTKISGLGTGLGLSTIYGFVKQSRGFIDLISAPGEGTTVDIYLPRHEGEEIAEETVALPSDVPTGNGERILVCEDDDDVRISVTFLLKGLGYEVQDVSSGREGCEAFEAAEGKFDALLTDVVLAGDMSGRDLSRWVEERYPDVAVLHMSGYAENHVVHGGIIEDGVKLMQKPFSKQQLAANIRDILTEK